MAITSKRIALSNVRLSFPSIFHRAEFKGGAEKQNSKPKFEATFLFPKETKEGKALHAQILGIINDLVTESEKKIPASKWAMKDGDEFDYDGYEGQWSIKASSTRRPTVIDRDKTPLTEDDEKIYAGCYVNAIVDFWVQDNEFGKRVNANLYGIQFVKDGEEFGAGSVDVTDDFAELSEDDFDFN